MPDTTGNLDQTALDALLQASPEQLEQALHLKEQGAVQASPDGVDLSDEALRAAMEQAEAIGNSVQVQGTQIQRNINSVSGQEQPALDLTVALLNSLKALESWMDLMPDGQAKHGMRAEIVNMREMLG